MKRRIINPLPHVERKFVMAKIFRGADAGGGLTCPASRGTLWGFTDRYSWVPGPSGGTYDQALIFDSDYHPKPAYAAISAALS